MMAKPMITLELQYPMIQFLIITVIYMQYLLDKFQWNFNTNHDLSFKSKLWDENKWWKETMVQPFCSYFPVLENMNNYI